MYLSISLCYIVGKTTTILGMLNALHVRDYNRYFEALLALALGQEGQRCRRSSGGKSQAHGAATDLSNWSNLVNGLSSKGIKPHLLVVAPSNVAVNNIIEKIMEKGFKDSSGSTYYPYILRIGSARSRDNSDSGQNRFEKLNARSVSLEESVETLLREEVDENVLLLKKKLQESVQEIIHLQTILLTLNHFFLLHPLSRGWELRVQAANAQPYWVDHRNRCTTPNPPAFTSDQGVAFTSVDSLPEYKTYAHSFVQLLEQLRVTSLRSARLKAIMQHSAEFGTRQMGVLKQTLEASFIEEADIVFSTLNSAGIKNK
jgi:hypothetical protein